LPVLNSTRDSSFDVTLHSGRGAIPGNNVRPLLDYTPDLPYASSESVSTPQLTLVLNATMFRPFGTNCEIEKWYSCFEEIMLRYGGRPHWAKNFLGPDKTARDTRPGAPRGISTVVDDWYGDRIARFRLLRSHYDPHGTFLSGLDWALANGIITP
jgi:D-arabinono-1,4-lactone oxidase